MAEIYFYIDAAVAKNAVECGLKLSEYSQKTVIIKGEEKKCISALLNPKDDMYKYKSSAFRCLKFELPSDNCFVGDSFLYKVGLSSPEAMKIYTETLVPIDNYIFGSFRLPECLVTTTVLPDQISVLDKRLDSPVLFNSSEEFYVNNIIQIYKEENSDFNDAMLYYFYSKLSQEGKLKKIEDMDNKIAVFIDNEKGKFFSIKVPDIGKY
jgi:hypothetical protein